MPIKSPKQFGLMKSVVNGSSNLKSGIGPSPSVAKEFINKTPKKKQGQFAKALKNKY